VGLLFKNNAETTLSSGINNSTTTIPVASAAVFPTPDANNKFFATLDDSSNVEVVLVTAISSNNLTVVRAQDNTSAAAFGSGTKIELRLTAKVLETGTTSLSDLDGDTKIQVEESSDEDKIRFDTAGTERMTIFETGDVAIGPNGSNPFGISYTGTDFAISEATGTASVQIDGGDAARMDFGVGSTALFRMYTDTSNFTEFKRTTDHPILFLVNNAETARFMSTEFKLASGKKLVGGASNVDFTIQSEHRTEIIGANKGTVILKDQGTAYALFERPTGTNDFDIQNPISDGDITFVGNDDGTTITALTLDMSNSGDAVFRRQITCREAIYINTADNSATTGYLYDDSGDFVLRSFTQDKDIVFKGNDGGSIITPLRIDMSTGGRAIFNSDLIALDTVGQYLQMAGTGGTYWAIGSTGGSNPPSTASTTLAFHHYDGSNWNNEVEFDSGGNIVADGNITAYSDERLKDNIKTLEDGLAKVNQLRGVSYNKDNKKGIGVIAQEVEKVFPEVVITGKTEDKFKSVDYGRLTAVLIEAVKEQQKQIQTLTTKVEELEAK
tara:strand:- start:1939 stop:3603 length:1665 start_codon:yes stop_codon:yes gene_type:complete